MIRAYKTEINPGPEQQKIINKTIGICRFVYNFYLAHNQKVYQEEHRFVSAMDFSKWMNNVFLKDNPDHGWIKEVSSKSVKQSILNAEIAYKKFFKKQAAFPRFKKKNQSNVSMYFVKNDAKTLIACERHRIKIPTLGWVCLKEKGYIPTNFIIKSGTISKKAGRFYVSVLVEQPDLETEKPTGEGIGIDLGVAIFLITSDGLVKKNINKSKKVKKLERRLIKEQRRLSRKYDCRNKKSKEKEATRQNIYKQQQKVQKAYQRLNNIRQDYVNKSVSELVKTKPAYITIEDLNVKGMMKNRCLSKAIAAQNFHTFRLKLKAKCASLGIELRVVDRFYPSSKKCHACGQIKKDLKRSDRIYECGCGHKLDRDLNASLNLRDALIYKIA